MRLQNLNQICNQATFCVVSYCTVSNILEFLVLTVLDILEVTCVTKTTDETTFLEKNYL